MIQIDKDSSHAEVACHAIELDADLPYVFGETIFIGKEPDDPSSCITIYDTGGESQESILAIDTSNVQIRSRAKTYKEAHQTSNKIKVALQSISPFNLTEKRVVGIWVTTPSTYIGVDEQDRAIFTLNIKITTEPTTKGNRQ